MAALATQELRTREQQRHALRSTGGTRNGSAGSIAQARTERLCGQLQWLRPGTYPLAELSSPFDPLE
jgi:hypothetical protein